MRFVIFGAGAIGGVLGGRLYEHGHEVTLIARGLHYEAIRDGGLLTESPDGSSLLRIPVVSHPSALTFDRDHVVLLTVKSQDTAQALGDLAASAASNVAVVCTQNGVENERTALRFSRTCMVPPSWCQLSI